MQYLQVTDAKDSGLVEGELLTEKELTSFCRRNDPRYWPKVKAKEADEKNIYVSFGARFIRYE